jgi:hypothetical protein
MRRECLKRRTHENLSLSTLIPVGHCEAATTDTLHAQPELIAVQIAGAQPAVLVAVERGGVIEEWEQCGPTKDEIAIRQSCSNRSRLLANQSQHVPTPLEARPPDRVVPGGIAL